MNYKFVDIEEEDDETYLGYEKWLPTPPKVVKPRSVFNAATLAYVGDCIYEVSYFLISKIQTILYDFRISRFLICIFSLRETCSCMLVGTFYSLPLVLKNTMIVSRQLCAVRLRYDLIYFSPLLLYFNFMCCRVWQ